MIGRKAHLPTQARKLGVAIRDGTRTRGQRVGSFEKGSSRRGDACEFGCI